MGEQSFVWHGRHRGHFLDRLAHGIAQAMEHALDADGLAARPGFLQKLDPRVKLGIMLGLIILAVYVTSLGVLVLLFLLAVALALGSRIPIARLARQAWLGVLVFTGLIALPAVFLVPGDALFTLPILSWTATLQGARSAAFLLGRSETAATFALLLVLSTPWPHLLKAMRAFRVPVAIVVVLGMTHRYVFVLLQAASQMIEARRSRLVGHMSPRDRRRLATATAGTLLGKALETSTEVHLAMISRGYRGEPRLLEDFRTRPVDWMAVASFLGVAAMALRLQA